MPQSGEDRTSRERRIMKEGKKKYIAELAKQFAQLGEWSEVRDASGRLEAGRRIYRIVHTLKGSAPMFGFTRVGSVAQRLVDLWDWTQDEPAWADAEASERFEASLRQAQSSLAELELELDMCRRELELDDQQDQLQRAMGSVHGERLLVIDDDDALRSYLVRRLKLDGFEVDEASDVQTAKRLLREYSYHLVTLDLMMHPESGYELFEFLKDDPTLKWVPLIVLSGREDVHDKIRCFYLGADDYVTKPFQYEELNARIYSLLKRTRTFEQMAFRDPLTGVYNRRFFDHQIQVELQRVARYPAPISLVFIDIDRFKSVNDTYGHHAGDLVLQGLAHVLQHHIRGTDLLARFGGEEFVIVFPNTNGADAKKAVEHLLRETRNGPVAQLDGHAFTITFSAGVAEWVPHMAIEDWIACADEAMYESKQQGRNRVTLFSGPVAGGADLGTAASTVRKKVLIADDDKILRSILIAKLRHLPVDFMEAADGEQAYRMLMDEPADLCILDGVMPRLDGYAMLERLGLEDRRPPGVKVLILSGRSREEEMKRGLQLGADAYMHKPFSMVELELKVRELLELP